MGGKGPLLEAPPNSYDKRPGYWWRKLSIWKIRHEWVRRAWTSHYRGDTAESTVSILVILSGTPAGAASRRRQCYRALSRPSVRLVPMAIAAAARSRDLGQRFYPTGQILCSPMSRAFHLDLWTTKFPCCFVLQYEPAITFVMLA